MKICLAQTKAIKGDILGNIENHKRVIHLAVSHQAHAIFFPELSLTGYEPELAEALAIDPEDKKLDDFQELSNAHQIIIGVGMPTKVPQGICISMIIFQPNQKREVYAKKYLHPDEELFFVNGKNTIEIIGNNIGLAICYELSIPAHAENAFKQGASIYLASVAKSADGVEKASFRLAEIAKQYSMTILMVNAIGFSDNFESAGKSAIWSKQAGLLAQLGNEEGIIIYDTETQITGKYRLK